MHQASSFGIWLRQRRESLGLTRESLASQIGYAVETIRKIEHDARRPSLQVAGKLAVCLAVSEAERAEFFLFARTGRPSAAHGEPSADDRLRLPAQRVSLAAPLGPLVGRQDDEALIRRLLLDPAIRLVTMTGPPGVGKTRLAVQVAQDLQANFADGAVFVPLAPLSDPHWVMAAIAERVGVKEDGQNPLHVLLATYLRSRRILLIVDNFEHVLDAGAAFAELLQSAPFVQALVTSRIVLGVGGEHVVPIAPLTVPSLSRLAAPAELARYTAIELFVQRARAADPSFRLGPANAAAIAEICHRLDGLPLAIELAAARINVLTADGLRRRLRTKGDLLNGGSRDNPGRQATLRSAIAWSYEALTSAEQRLFVILSVCRGGLTLAAAEELGATYGDSPETVFEAIAGLISNSLLVRSKALDRGPLDDDADDWLMQYGQRFGMLELIREYALEQLALSGNESGARRHHAEHYLRLAECAEAELAGQDVKVWADVLEQEHENFRAALAWLITNEEFDRAGRMAASLWQFWESRAYVTEGLYWLGILTDSRDQLSLPVRADVLNAAGRLAHNQGDLARATDLFTANLELRRQLGDQRRVGYALNDLGVMLAYSGRGDEGIALLNEGLSMFRTAGDLSGIADVQLNFGYVLLNVVGDIEQAVAHLEEGRTAFETVGNLRGTMATIGNLGYAYAQQDDPRALATMRQALVLARRLDDRIGCLYSILIFAIYMIRDQQCEHGVLLLSAAEACRATIGLQPIPGFDVPSATAIAREHLGESCFMAMWEAGQNMSLEQAVANLLEDRAALHR